MGKKRAAEVLQSGSEPVAIDNGPGVQDEVGISANVAKDTALTERAEAGNRPANVGGESVQGSEVEERKELGSMTRRVSLYDGFDDGGEDSARPLEAVRLSDQEVPVIPFTAETEEVQIHYVDEPEIKGYIRCRGQGCLLCRIDRAPDTRMLLPVYLPVDERVGVLPVPRSLRPKALRPQLLRNFETDKPVVLFITRNGRDYHVDPRAVVDGEDTGETQIKRFTEEYSAGRIRLESVYQEVANKDLATCPRIAKMMRLKGIDDTCE